MLNSLNAMFHRSILNAIIYAAVSLLCLLSIFMVPFIRSMVIRISIGILLLCGFFYELTMLDITGQLPDAAQTSTIISNMRFGLEGTVGIYTTQILRNLWLVTILGVAFLWSPRKISSVALSRLSLVVVSLAFAGVTAISVRTSGYTSLFPSPVTSYVNIVDIILMDREKTLREVAYDGGILSNFEKIVLIMDESVRGDYLSINRPAMNTTPFLSSLKGLVNFGIASSATNCSIDTRLAIRHGMRASDLGHTWSEIMDRTTIWQYARYAGFKTIYIDSFGSPFGVPYGMTLTERSYIDERIAMNEMPHYQRDIRNAQILRNLLDRQEKMFIVVDKYGTHVPYDRMYPQEQNAFYADLSKPFNLNDTNETILHYKNAIKWSVDGFLQNCSFARCRRRPYFSIRRITGNLSPKGNPATPIVAHQDLLQNPKHSSHYL